MKTGRLIAAACALVLIVGLSVLSISLSPVPRGRNPLRQTVVVKSGQTLAAVGTSLKDHRVIRSAFAFRLYARLRGADQTIKTGTYEFAPGSSLRNILAKLERGDTIDERVLLVEGWTAQQVAEQLEKQGIIPAADFIAGISAPVAEVLPDRNDSFLSDRPATASLEGYLFPDTYQFLKGATTAHVIGKLLDTFERRVTPELMTQLRANGRSLFDGVTLASIVEREVSSPADRRLVADIFWRRLQIGQPLQSDATVNYVTRKGRASPSLEDTRAESPYNTYLQRGLPPGPIGNPGLDSLQAVANPTVNEYFYFLSGNDGQTHYARTYEEHLANRRLYLP